MITVNNVIKTYKTGSVDYPVLKGVNFHIKKGEFVLIMGKSGSGKSTLLNILTGVDKATSGDVIVNNHNIIKYSEKMITAWRGKNIGIVFQFFQLIPTLSVLENVLLPMDLVNKIPAKDRTEKALELLDHVGLKSHADKMPTSLSGGEQQRVAIARSMANDVNLIIADEPTGNLDSKNAQLIFDLLENLKKQGKTIIMVTHEREILKGVTRKILLKDGIIEEDRLINEGSDDFVQTI